MEIALRNRRGFANSASGALASFRRLERMAASERHVGLVGLIATWQGGRTADMPALVEEVLGLADVCRTIPQFPT